MNKIFFTSSIFVTILVAFFGEGLLLGSVYRFGPWVSLMIFIPLGIIINGIILSNYYSGLERGWLKTRIYRLFKRTNDKYKNKHWVKYGGIGVLFVAALVIGPLSTTIIFSLANSNQTKAHIFSIFANTLFFFLWIFIYSGIINIFHE